MKHVVKLIITGFLLISVTLTNSGCVVGNLTMADAPRWMEYLVEEVKRQLMVAIKDSLKQLLISRIQALILGEISGEEFFIVDWEEFLSDVANKAGVEFLNDFFGTNLCNWTNPRIQIVLKGMVIPKAKAPPPKCTLSQIVDNLDNVFDIKVGGGWDTFLTALEPQNNDLGIYVMAQGGTLAEIAAKRQEQQIRAIVGRGYKPKEKNGKITVPSTNIAETAEFVETINLKRLVESEDIAEIINAFISAMLTRIMREASR